MQRPELRLGGHHQWLENYPVAGKAQFDLYDATSADRDRPRLRSDRGMRDFDTVRTRLDEGEGEETLLRGSLRTSGQLGATGIRHRTLNAHLRTREGSAARRVQNPTADPNGVGSFGNAEPAGPASLTRRPTRVAPGSDSTTQVAGLRQQRSLDRN